MRQRRKNKIMIMSLLGFLFLMTVGYAAFQTNLKIKGTSNISSNWDILITSVTEGNKTGDAESANAPTWDKLTASMEANLYQKGDSIEYNIVVENRGTLDAKLENISNNIESGNEAILISFSGYTKGEKLLNGTSQTLKVRIEYNPNFEGVPEVGSSQTSIDLNYVQAGSEHILSTKGHLVNYDCTTNGGEDCSIYNDYVTEGENVNLNYSSIKGGEEFIGWNTDKDAKEGLGEYIMEDEDLTLYAIFSSSNSVIKKWQNDSKTDFHSDAYKSSIITATFLDHKNVPSNAVESWDVSEAGDGSVMAWVTRDKEDNTKHHLYIGGVGGVIANTNTAFLFYEFSEITAIDFNGNFDTSNATTMFAMFDRCKKLVHLDLSSFNTEKVTNMRSMFYECVNLESVNLLSFNTSNVTTMHAMFTYDEKLVNLNLCSFDTSKVKEMSYAFAAIPNLEKVYVGSKWIEAEDTTNMFSGSGISSVTTGSCMSDIIPPIKPSKPVIKKWLSDSKTDFHSDAYKSSIITATFLDHKNVPSSAVESWDVSEAGDGSVMAWVTRDKEDNTKHHLYIGGVDGVIANANTSFLFYEFLEITEIHFNDNFDTSNATTMFAMFDRCKKLVHLDLSSFNTEKVTNMRSMFYECVNLKTVDLSSFNTSNVTTMHAMFGLDSNLLRVDLCSFDTSKVTTMESMFNTTSNLGKVYVGSKWSAASNVTNMFSGSGVSSVTTGSCGSDTIPPTTPTYIAYFADGGEKDKYESGTPTSSVVYTKITSVDKGSGVSKIQYSVDNGKNWVDFSFTKSNGLNIDGSTAFGIEDWTVKNRNDTVIFRAIDKAGNISDSSKPFNIRYDVAIPTYIAYFEDGGESYRYKSGTWTSNLVLTKITSKSTATANIQYSLNNGSSWANLSFPYGGGIKKDDTGVYGIEGWTVKNRNETILFRAVDSSGRASSPSRPFIIRYDVNNPTLSVATSKTANSITVAAAVSAYSGISKNEFSIDDGKTYIDVGKSINYTFENLKSGTSYNIKVRTTSLVNKKTVSDTVSVRTSEIDVPTYKQSSLTNSDIVTITYPEGCGSKYSCFYRKNNGKAVKVNSSKVEVEFSESGSLVGIVSDNKNNTVSSSYSVLLKSRKIKNFNRASKEAFYSDTYKENILSVTFLDNNVVPDDAVESWDVSAVHDEGVIAYVVRNEADTSKYDLYIGARGGVIADEDCNSMFFKFSGLKMIDFNGNFDTSKVTTMFSMFEHCTSLTNIDFEGVDTSNVTTMASMFAFDSNLPTLDLREFNTSKVTTMNTMFGNCLKLTSVDVSSFDTSSVTDMRSMFNSDESLTSLDLRNFDTSKVTTMYSMFVRCNGLTSLNLCSFDTSNVTDMSGMFYMAEGLTKVYVGSKWDVSGANTKNLFSGSGISSVTTGQCG